MFDNKTINRLAPKYLEAVESVSDERSNGDGWWIYLKAPWFNSEMECRIIHEQTLKDCISILKEIVNTNDKKD